MLLTEEQIIDILLVAYTLHSQSSKLHNNENLKPIIDAARDELEHWCDHNGLVLFRDCTSIITYKKNNTYYLSRDQKTYCADYLVASMYDFYP